MALRAGLRFYASDRGSTVRQPLRQESSVDVKARRRDVTIAVRFMGRTKDYRMSVRGRLPLNRKATSVGPDRY